MRGDKAVPRVPIEMRAVNPYAGLYKLREEKGGRSARRRRRGAECVKSDYGIMRPGRSAAIEIRCGDCASNRAAGLRLEREGRGGAPVRATLLNRCIIKACIVARLLPFDKRERGATATMAVFDAAGHRTDFGGLCCERHGSGKPACRQHDQRAKRAQPGQPICHARRHARPSLSHND